MATKPTRYIPYLDAVLLHFEFMELAGEVRFGVAVRHLVESALARPQQAAFYEHADIIRQAATLCYGLVKNHPWLGGNKRTATGLMSVFLKRNGYRLIAPTAELIELSLAIESDRWKVDEIETWLRQYTAPLSV